MEKIKSIIDAAPAHMPGLKTWRALPQRRMDELDPFLFLNHHGPEHFEPNNNGLPFGPHPHRGFETLTFIVKGELVHKDSEGFSSRITTGGVQWMTAGAGIIHSETSSEQFLKEGGEIEVLQLWINLPAAKKNSPAHYQGIKESQIPHIELKQGVMLDLICGTWAEQSGPVESPYPQFMSTLRMETNTEIDLDLAANEQTLFYLVSGEIELEGQVIGKRQLVQLDPSAERLNIKAQSDTYIIYGHAKPLNEPIAAQGPFVMNTQAEIQQAFMDYQAGKMGVWRD